jgi:hypothetical protein
VDKSRRKLMINSSMLGLSLAGASMLPIVLQKEKSVLSKIKGEYQILQNTWDKTFRETAVQYLNALPINVFSSIQMLRNKISDDFFSGATVSVNGLLLSKTEAALVLNVENNP